MMRWIVVCVLALWVSTAEASPSAEGTWAFTFLGETLTMTLGPDGRGSEEGDVIHWSQEGTTVRIRYPDDGEVEVGTLKGADTLVFEDGSTFRRVGGASAATQRGPAPRVAPPPAGAIADSPRDDALMPAPGAPKVLPGRTVTLDSVGVTLTLPKGWTEQAAAQGRQLRPPGVPQSEGGLAIASSAADDQARSLPLETQLQQLAVAMQQQFAAAGLTLRETAGGRKTFQVSGRPAGRVLLEGRTPTGEAVHVYAGGLVAGEWLYFLSGNWTAKHHARLLAGADSVLASLRPRPPKENVALRGRLAGCWRKSQGSSGYGNSGSYEETWLLHPDGRFEQRTAVTVSVPGAGGISRGGSQGRWRVVGSSLLLSPEGEASSTVPFTLQGGILVAGGNRYLPCR